MPTWSKTLVLAAATGISCSCKSSITAAAFSVLGPRSIQQSGWTCRDWGTARARTKDSLLPLYSIRTGGAGTPGMDDEKTGYGPELIEDPDAALTPEEWEKKYGEEVDTTVLYDEKVR